MTQFSLAAVRQFPKVRNLLRILFSFFADLALTGWCQLAYWELSERVGLKVPVEDAAVDVFGEQTRGAGLCIKTIAQQRSSSTPDLVLKTREKIGLGELLERPSLSL
jgi:hypothetical protein